MKKLLLGTSLILLCFSQTYASNYSPHWNPSTPTYNSSAGQQGYNPYAGNQPSQPYNPNAGVKQGYNPYYTGNHAHQPYNPNAGQQGYNPYAGNQTHQPYNPNAGVKQQHPYADTQPPHTYNPHMPGHQGYSDYDQNPSGKSRPHEGEEQRHTSQNTYEHTTRHEPGASSEHRGEERSSESKETSSDRSHLNASSRGESAVRQSSADHRLVCPPFLTSEQFEEITTSHQEKIILSSGHVLENDSEHMDYRDNYHAIYNHAHFVKGDPSKSLSVQLQSNRTYNKDMKCQYTVKITHRKKNVLLETDTLHTILKARP